MAVPKMAAGIGLSRRGIRYSQGVSPLSYRQAWISRPFHHSPPAKSSPAAVSSPASQHRSAQQRPQSSPPSRQARALSPLILVGLLLGGTAYHLLSPSPSDKTLNDTTFVPYTITSREAISPTSFVITIAPQSPNPSLPYLEASSSQWKWPLWSVEFKQPEVQISRHYTPLPPQEGEDPKDGSLRFYIRAVGDGEMSNYLCRRAVGQEVWLRGPHVGFALRERLGGQKDVAFLAGGTGVAPGMQAAKAVLDGSRVTRVDLLWAVRKREEVQRSAAPSTAKPSWKFWQEKGPTPLGTGIHDPSPVAERLRQMKAAYGDRLGIQVVVDEEATEFREKDIRAALLGSSKNDMTTLTSHSSGCSFHDQKAHETVSEFETRDKVKCTCSLVANSKPGKNLFIVSGPDGFVSHYAGPKVWLGGQQTQGPIGGVAAQLQRQHPSLAQDWLVLKL